MPKHTVNLDQLANGLVASHLVPAGAYCIPRVTASGAEACSGLKGHVLLKTYEKQYVELENPTNTYGDPATMRLGLPEMLFEVLPPGTRIEIVVGK